MELLKAYLIRKDIQKIIKSRPGDEGFSLVELVVVIAVLAILAAVAIPSFQGVQSRAKTSAVKNGLVNGVKECIVSDGLDQGTTYDKSQAFKGDYTGYTFQKRNQSVDSCYKAQAVADDPTNFPWFVIEYDPQTGVTSKSCEGNKVGCKSDKW